MTDFGLSDPFVGQMNGVIESIAPGTPVIDLCHDVPPQNIEVGSLFLESSIRYFPEGSIFVAVVDPGVGTSRRGIAVAWNNKCFIGPDNGLFGFLAARDNDWEGYALEDSRFRLPDVSSTFHGRDIFTPAAAHIAGGRKINGFGPKLDSVIQLDGDEPKVSDESIIGRIVHVDRFGNAWSNVSKDHLVGAKIWNSRVDVTISIGHTTVSGIGETYGIEKSLKPAAIINSFYLLEIAVPGGSATEALNISEGDALKITLK